jgi:hypothetical protein
MTNSAMRTSQQTKEDTDQYIITRRPEFARFPNGGLIMTSSALAARHRDRIIALAAGLRLRASSPSVTSPRHNKLVGCHISQNHSPGMY